MSSLEILESPSEWIPNTIVTLLFTIINFKILWTEIKKRKEGSGDATFTTKQFKVWSIVCMISCVATPCSVLLSRINLICTFIGSVKWISTSITFLSMGFYQLSRLHYCFANSQIHSHKGYPKWLFNIMYTFGALIAFNYIISIEFAIGIGFKSKCGINDKFEYHHHPISITNSTAVGEFYVLASGWSYLLWDFVTLYLYISKIRTFRIYKDTDPIVYKRIKSVLQKIFILTMFYQLTCLFSAVMFGLLVAVIDIPSISMQLFTGILPLTMITSMYLMMDHNEREYMRFLKVVQFLKFHFLCCKWRHFVMEQLDDMEEDVQIMVEVNNNNKESPIETKNKSILHHKLEMPEVSVPSDMGLSD